MSDEEADIQECLAKVVDLAGSPSDEFDVIKLAGKVNELLNETSRKVGAHRKAAVRGLIAKGFTMQMIARETGLTRGRINQLANE